MTTFDLKTQEALAEIRRRRDVGALAQLQESMRTRFAGKRCLVVGSAPYAVLPKTDAFDVCICVNGSAWTVQRDGRCRPDLTIIAGWSTRSNNDVRIATQKVWEDMDAGDVMFIESGASAEEGRPILDRCGLRYGRFQAIDQIDRAVIIGDVCEQELGWGKRDDRVSNGIFAAILAIWAEASEVILSGITLQGGHAYIEGETPRQHLQGDKAFLSLMPRLTVKIAVTAGELGAPGPIEAAS